MINRSLKLLVITGSLSQLVACSGSGIDEVREWMEQTKKETRVNIPKIREPKTYTPFAYEGKGVSDPFDSKKLTEILEKIRAQSSNGLKPDLERRREILEEDPLDSLKMVGVIEDKTTRYAIIQMQGKNKIVHVRVGNYIGQNFGKILKISESHIEINEIVQDAAGEWTERLATLELQEAK